MTYGGALEFNFLSYTPVVGDQTTLFNMSGGASASGDFSSVRTGSLLFTDDAGVWSAIDDGANVALQFNDQNGEFSVYAVPEPSTIGFFGVGFMILLLFQAHRHSRSS